MQDVICWNYGGGVQTTAIAILVRKGLLPKPDLVAMANTDREGSATWEYTDAVVRPLLAEIGLEIEIVPHSYATVDLYSHKGELLIPAYTATGKLDTYCSNEWKARVVDRWLRNVKGVKSCVSWIGISLDEIGRMKLSNVKWKRFHYPLVFDIPMRRYECLQLVRDFGLPEPPKSSCWMCPHRKNPQWVLLRDQYPDDWRKACELDESIRQRDEFHSIYLHYSAVPLREADLTVEPLPDLPLFGQVDGCDSGYCWV